jgi:hypothetical protein
MSAILYKIKLFSSKYTHLIALPSIFFEKLRTQILKLILKARGYSIIELYFFIRKNIIKYNTVVPKLHALWIITFIVIKLFLKFNKTHLN